MGGVVWIRALAYLGVNMRQLQENSRWYLVQLIFLRVLCVLGFIVFSLEVVAYLFNDSLGGYLLFNSQKGDLEL